MNHDTAILRATLLRSRVKTKMLAGQWRQDPVELERKLQHELNEGSQPPPDNGSFVSFVESETIEVDQAPGDIVSAFVGRKISDKVAAATRNDAAPILGALLERVPLERVYLVADDAGIVNGVLLVLNWSGGTPAPKAAPIVERTSHSFAARHLIE